MCSSLTSTDVTGGLRFQATDLHRGKITGTENLRAIVDDVKGRLDSLSEMGEMESLRLQMAMDRLSRLMSTLSNLMKKSQRDSRSNCPKSEIDRLDLSVRIIE